MTRPLAEYEEADRWVRWGMNDCAIARLTGVPRPTVMEWRHRERKDPGWRTRKQLSHSDCPKCDGAPLNESAYAYLLGLYLGDGCISAQHREVYRLRVDLDQRYPGIIQECRVAMRAMRRGQHGRVGFIAAIGCVEVYACWRHWPCLFPQHGPGPKHRRSIRLEAWQKAIVDSYPHRLLRGLIHSDGWRGVNRVNGKPYPRYQFSNTSDDIRGIFTDACDAFGVNWRRMNARNIAISRRDDVGKLDMAVGLKS